MPSTDTEKLQTKHKGKGNLGFNLPCGLVEKLENMEVEEKRIEHVSLAGLQVSKIDFEFRSFISCI